MQNRNSLHSLFFLHSEIWALFLFITITDPIKEVEKKQVDILLHPKSLCCHLKKNQVSAEILVNMIVT